jgi:hypothetical protein
VAVGAVLSNEDALHWVIERHARLLVAVGAKDSYSVSTKQAVMGEQARSEVVVSCAETNSASVQTVSVAHSRSEVLVSATDSYSSFVHIARSAQVASDVSAPLDWQSAE